MREGEKVCGWAKVMEGQRRWREEEEEVQSPGVQRQIRWTGEKTGGVQRSKERPKRRMIRAGGLRWTGHLSFKPQLEQTLIE